MLTVIVICCLSFCRLLAMTVCPKKVFADADVKSVSVMEGDSVFLKSETDLQINEALKWRFGPQNSLIAEINKGNVNFSTHGRFRDRLKLDKTTGSLTITNITTEDAGLYELRRKTVYRFNLTVYPRLPVPVISKLSSYNHSSSTSSSRCALLCSVVNVSHVTLSWLRGHRSFSSVSVSGHSIGLALHLDCLNDSYSCVVAYSFTNRTTHLTNTDLCQKCPDSVSLMVLISASAGSLVIVSVVLIFCICKKCGKTDQEVETHEEEITYADPIFYKRETEK